VNYKDQNHSGRRKKCRFSKNLPFPEMLQQDADDSSSDENLRLPGLVEVAEILGQHNQIDVVSLAIVY
jgi:hypothetical protein